VHQLSAKVYAYMNARDKMPFEVTPIVYRLQRYDEARADVPAAAPTAPAPGDTAAPPADAPPPPPPAAPTQ